MPGNWMQPFNFAMSKWLMLFRSSYSQEHILLLLNIGDKNTLCNLHIGHLKIWNVTVLPVSFLSWNCVTLNFPELSGTWDALCCLSVLLSLNWTVFTLCNCMLCNQMFIFLMFITKELGSVLLPKCLFDSVK